MTYSKRKLIIYLSHFKLNFTFFTDETTTVLSESVNNFSENLSAKFLTENILLENQQPKETTKMSNFQNLADCIKSNDHNKIITLFDPESSIRKFYFANVLVIQTWYC